MTWCRLVNHRLSDDLPVIVETMSLMTGIPFLAGCCGVLSFVEYSQQFADLIYSSGFFWSQVVYGC